MISCSNFICSDIEPSTIVSIKQIHPFVGFLSGVYVVTLLLINIWAIVGAAFIIVDRECVGRFRL